MRSVDQFALGLFVLILSCASNVTAMCLSGLGIRRRQPAMPGERERGATVCSGADLADLAGAERLWRGTIPVVIACRIRGLSQIYVESRPFSAVCEAVTVRNLHRRG